MHCDEARDRLLDRLDEPSRDSPELSTHLETCNDCQELAGDILAIESQSRVWHDIAPPPWHARAQPWPDRGGTRPAMAPWAGLVQQWFPLAASTAALLLALGLYLPDRATSQAPLPLPGTVQAGAAPAADALLAASRRERRQEMEALTALLKAEMDRRSLETEESLRYIIAHQIQSQRELESMRGRLVATERPGEQL